MKRVAYLLCLVWFVTGATCRPAYVPTVAEIFDGIALTTDESLPPELTIAVHFNPGTVSASTRAYVLDRLQRGFDGLVRLQLASEPVPPPPDGKRVMVLRFGPGFGEYHGVLIGGISYVWLGAWVYTDSPGLNKFAIANTAAHEGGHMIGWVHAADGSVMDTRLERGWAWYSRELGVIPQ